MDHLPEPDADARAHSERLADLIRAQIRAAGGAIPFSRFMELALYAPGLGYYSAGARKFGADGDFVTAPELGPVFATASPTAVAPVLRALGAGRGVLRARRRQRRLRRGGAAGAARAATRCRRATGCSSPAPTCASASASACARSCRRSCSRAAGGWTAPPAGHGAACCSPTKCSTRCRRRASPSARARSTRSTWCSAPTAASCASTSPPTRCCAPPCATSSATSSASCPSGYRSEVLPQLPYWIQAVGGLLREGAMLFVDYGYPRSEYYLPERSDGTLRCFYRHRAHDDPFFLPGPAGPHRLRGLHRAGRSRRQRRLRLRRLLHAGGASCSATAWSSSCRRSRRSPTRPNATAATRRSSA